MTDDLEALFDQISAEREKTAAEQAPAPAVAIAPDPSPAPHESEPASVVATLAPDNPADKPLYERVGAILRQLHNSLRELGLDRALQDVASEVHDAKSRLEYVASLTEQAATRVLNSIDIALPQQETVANEGRDLEARWKLLFDGNLGIDDFKVLAADSHRFASSAATTAEAEKARLMEIMMAQDFQDLTGQIIKKVVVITQRLEQELAQLLRDNMPASMKEKGVDLLSGPDIPTKAMDQDDVDSLLANLGF